MATYFQAQKAEHLFREYRELALKFWELDASCMRPSYSGITAQQQADRELWTNIRESINKLSPAVQYYAQGLGMNTRAHAMPPAMIGGPGAPFDFLTQVLEREVGYSRIPTKDVLDAIDRCIGAAELCKRNTLWKQALNPAYYLTVAVAYALRIPFMMLELAGIPEEVETSVWAHIVKALFLVFLIWLTAHYGLKVSFPDVLKFFK